MTHVRCRLPRWSQWPQWSRCLVPTIGYTDDIQQELLRFICDVIWSTLPIPQFLKRTVFRPPGTTVPDGLMFYRRCIFFFVSPLVLQAPSTDRPETLPHGRNLAEFYNPTPKIRGRSPQKIGGQKHAKFRSILDHFRL